MAALERPVAKPRPVYLDLFAIRQPLPAIVSILHRASGVLLFFVGIPVLLWGVAASLGGEASYAAFLGVLRSPLARLLLLLLVWAYLHHLLAGVRHVLQDVHVGGELKAARQSAAAVVALALLLTILVAVRLW